MSLIVISREMGSAGTQLGRAVAQRLGYRFGDREVILEAVKRYHIPEEGLSQLEEGKPRRKRPLAGHHRSVDIRAPMNPSPMVDRL